MNYRSAIVALLAKVTDEKLLRRVWRLLETAYSRQ